MPPSFFIIQKNKKGNLFLKSTFFMKRKVIRMKTRPAPVADLISYISDIYINKNKRNKYKNIFQIMDEYYCKLSKYKSILPVEDFAFEDWCDLNWDNDINTCPNTPGIIVYKNIENTRKYGILYYSGMITSQENQTDNLSYYEISASGIIASHGYQQDDWHGWGAPTKYFELDPNDYIDSEHRYFGERILRKDMFGHDVVLLQKILQKIFPDLEITRRFDEATLAALHEIQKFINIPEENIFNCKTVSGKKILNFILNKNDSNS